MNYLISHPSGQLFMLFCFTVPIGIWSLVVAQDSYDILEDAIGDFEGILRNWETVPITNITAVACLRLTGLAVIV